MYRKLDFHMGVKERLQKLEKLAKSKPKENTITIILVDRDGYTPFYQIESHYLVRQGTNLQAPNSPYMVV